MERRTIEAFFFLTLLVGTLGVVVFMFWPFFGVLFLASVLAFLLSGVNERLAKKFKSRGLAALVTTVGALLVILVPISFLIWQAAQEAAGLYRNLQIFATPEAVLNLFDTVWDRVGPLVPWLSVDHASFAAGIKSMLAWVVSHTDNIVASIGNATIKSFILLFVLFFFLRDSIVIRRKLMDLSPLSDTHENQIIGTITRTIAATVRGKILIAFLQGLVAGLGFLIFGVPAPVLWGGVLMLASFVPHIGTALVMIPIIIYLLATSTFGAALGMALWSIFLVSLLDNFLGPKLMAQGTHTHALLVFLSVLGGLSLFGPIGILLGPVVMALLHALFDIYLSLVKKK